MSLRLNLKKRSNCYFFISIAFIAFVLFFFLVFFSEALLQIACLVNKHLSLMAISRQVGSSTVGHKGAWLWALALGGANATGWHDEFDFLASLLLLHVWHILAALDLALVVLGSWLVGRTAVSRHQHFLLVSFLATLRADWQLATAEAQTLADLLVACLVVGLARVLRSWGWLGWSLRRVAAVRRRRRRRRGAVRRRAGAVQGRRGRRAA